MTGVDGNEFGLVMPFVACTSQGGPYDDDSFVAGFTCAFIEAMMAEPHGYTIERAVPPALLPQLDLIAMRHGWTLTSLPWEEAPDEWALATFDRTVASHDSGLAG